MHHWNASDGDFREVQCSDYAQWRLGLIKGNKREKLANNSLFPESHTDKLSHIYPKNHTSKRKIRKVLLRR